MITLDTTPNRTYENSGTLKVKIQDPGAWMEGPRLRIMHEETRVQDPTWGTLNTIKIQDAVHYMEVPEQFQAHKPSQDSGRRTQKNIYESLVFYFKLSTVTFKNLDTELKKFIHSLKNTSTIKYLTS